MSEVEILMGKNKSKGGRGRGRRRKGNKPKREKKDKKKSGTAADSAPTDPRPTKRYDDTWYAPPYVYGALLRSHLQTLRTADEQITAGFVKAIDAIAKEFKNAAEVDAHDHLDDLAGQHHQEADAKRWTGLMLLAVLYHGLEDRIRAIISIRLSGLDDKPREDILWNLHNWKKLRLRLKEHLNVELHHLKSYRVVDELRLVVNSVKHSGGSVSSKLAKLDGFKKNRTLHAKDGDLDRYGNACCTFVEDLVTKAETETQKRFGEPTDSESELSRWTDL